MEKAAQIATEKMPEVVGILERMNILISGVSDQTYATKKYIDRLQTFPEEKSGDLKKEITPHGLLDSFRGELRRLEEVHSSMEENNRRLRDIVGE